MFRFRRRLGAIVATEPKVGRYSWRCGRMAAGHPSGFKLPLFLLVLVCRNPDMLLQGGATGRVLVMEDWPECFQKCTSILIVSYRIVVVLLVLLVMSCGNESI